MNLVIMTSGGSILGVKFLDPLAGLVVSGMIVKAGLQTGYHRYCVISSVYMSQFYFASYVPPVRPSFEPIIMFSMNILNMNNGHIDLNIASD